MSLYRHQFVEVYLQLHDLVLPSVLDILLYLLHKFLNNFLTFYVTNLSSGIFYNRLFG